MGKGEVDRFLGTGVLQRINYKDWLTSKRSSEHFGKRMSRICTSRELWHAGGVDVLLNGEWKEMERKLSRVRAPFLSSLNFSISISSYSSGARGAEETAF